MWHASIARHGRLAKPGAEHEERALRALRSVGDPIAGEWREATDRAFHLRRRLSAAEIDRTGLAMRDIRGTAEAQARTEAMARWVPPSILYIDSQ